MSEIQEIYSLFPLILQERMSYKRRTFNGKLAQYSHAIVFAMAVSERDEYIFGLLNEKIALLLQDCEIYHDMVIDKAMDAMAELSNFAAIYVNSNRQEIYHKITVMIKDIRVSYPVVL